MCMEKGFLQVDTKEGFVWSSGMQSPMYCDFRNVFSDVTVRRQLVSEWKELILREFAGVDAVIGTATAGIPHASWLAEELDLPMGYARSKPKAHGLGKQIEGGIGRGVKVLIVEDLISTGGSSANAVEACTREGYEVVGITSLFSYGLQKAVETFAELEVEAHSLYQFDDLLPLLDGDKVDVRAVKEWHKKFSSSK